jgi:hypothetical protein
MYYILYITSICSLYFVYYIQEKVEKKPIEPGLFMSQFRCKKNKVGGKMYNVMPVFHHILILLLMARTAPFLGCLAVRLFLSLYS